MKSLAQQLAILAILVSLLGSCVSAPTALELRDAGFRTPEKTFEALQIGVAADLPRLEYRCLSSGFRARFNGGQGLSQIAYREFRDEVLSKRLEFWLGIPDAELLEVSPLGEGRCLLKAVSHGVEFELEMVREDFWQMWSGDELLADVPLPFGSFHQWAEVYREGTGTPNVTGFAVLPNDMALMDVEQLNREMTEFRIGREWKIDHIGGLEP